MEGLHRKGFSAPEGILLRADFETVRAVCTGALLVIDPVALDAEGSSGGDVVRVRHMPPEAFLNLDPYRPPTPVEAAGGYVMRRVASGVPELLMIFRRGVWDLPKGKRDEGETVEACALREVREEVGAAALRVVRPLGTTVHGYPEGACFRVKTTHWFLMTTSEVDFTPQEEEEDIERVTWVPWPEARRRVGYETLRRHMANLDAMELEELLG